MIKNLLSGCGCLVLVIVMLIGGCVGSGALFFNNVSVTETDDGTQFDVRFGNAVPEGFDEWFIEDDVAIRVAQAHDTVIDGKSLLFVTVEIQNRRENTEDVTFDISDFTITDTRDAGEALYVDDSDTFERTLSPGETWVGQVLFNPRSDAFTSVYTINIAPDFMTETVHVDVDERVIERVTEQDVRDAFENW